MNTTNTSGYSLHQCVCCGNYRDDEIDALLCAACAIALTAARETLAAPAFDREAPASVRAERSVLAVHG